MADSIDRSYGGLADGQARLYFLDLAAWSRDLDAAQVALVRAMTSLLRE